MSGMCYVAPSWTAPRQGPRRQRRSSRSISYEHSRRAPGRGTVSTRFSLKRFDCARGSTRRQPPRRSPDRPPYRSPRGAPTLSMRTAPRAAAPRRPLRGARRRARPRPSECANDCGNAMLRNLRCMYIGHSSQPGAPPPSLPSPAMGRLSTVLVALAALVALAMAPAAEGTHDRLIATPFFCMAASCMPGRANSLCAESHAYSLETAF